MPHVRMSAYVSKLALVHGVSVCVRVPGVGILRIFRVPCWLASSHGEREEGEEDKARN